MSVCAAGALVPLAAATLLFAGCARRPAPPLTVAALRGASYHCEYVEQGRVTLEDGRFEAQGETPIRIRMLDAVAQGDLDGDGSADAAVVLVADPGGSGTFYQLAPVLNRGGRARNVTTVFLGDRVKLDGVRIEEGRIVVNLVAHEPDDPMCCPTHKETRVYRMAGQDLARTDDVREAPPSR